MANKQATIYALIDPCTEKIRYIGKTNNPKNRLRQHIKANPNERSTPVKSWIKSLVKKGLLPQMVEIEKCSQDLWEEREKFWIKRFKDQGEEILNLAEGGNQPLCDDETRKKNAEKMNDVRHKGILALIRFFSTAARENEARGCVDRALLFRDMASLVKSSKGIRRQRLGSYGMEKFYGQNKPAF